MILISHKITIITKKVRKCSKRKAELKYKNWSVPKFEIVDKYKITTKNLRKPNIIEYKDVQ